MIYENKIQTMKFSLGIILIFLLLQSCATTKPKYLQKNRFDLHEEGFSFPQKDFKILGFGAYHGSAKTEHAELMLLKPLLESQTIKYYLPETDYSIGHYFNLYLETGDTILLKDLVTNYGERVPQERTIEVYEKWKELKKLNDQFQDKDRIEVIGLDRLVNYKYLCRHLVGLLASSEKPVIKVLSLMVQQDTTDFSLSETSAVSRTLQEFMADFENNPNDYDLSEENRFEVEHLVRNLEYSFQFYENDRDKTMLDNYASLSAKYNFDKKSQFLRMGFTHICKSREGDSSYPYFFTRLIEKNIYNRDQVVSVIGYLTASEVVWDEIYDENGDYTGHTKEAGYGIGDYDLEYFRGIEHLKKNKQSDITLFRLNKKKSPYVETVPDLIEVIMKEDESNGMLVKGMSTLDFLDYAILISNSNAGIPIYEMK